MAPLVRASLLPLFTNAKAPAPRADPARDAGSHLAGLLVSLGSTEPDPARTAQFHDQVQSLCAGLNEAERRLLELRAQGYTPAEAAAELGLSAVAFRVRLTRLRQRLRDAGVLDDWL